MVPMRLARRKSTCLPRTSNAMAPLESKGVATTVRMPSKVGMFMPVSCLKDVPNGELGLPPCNRFQTNWQARVIQACENSRLVGPHARRRGPHDEIGLE